jgi:hypothetical protein
MSIANSQHVQWLLLLLLLLLLDVKHLPQSSTAGVPSLTA